MPGLTSKHAIGTGVAAAVIAVALGDGGFHPKGLALIAAAGWVALLFGLACGLANRRRLPGDAVLVLAGLLGLTLLSAASLGWSPDPGRAFAETVRWAAYAGAFALVVLIRRRRGARGALVGLTVALVSVGAIALGGRLLVELPADEALVEALPTAEGLLSFPIGYWNGLAACMAIALVGLAWLSAASRAPRTRRLAVAAMPLAGLAIFLAESRGGALAALAGLVALFALSSRRAPLAGSIVIGLLGGAALIAIAAPLDALQLGSESPEAQRQGVALLGALLAVSVLAGAAAPTAERVGSALAPGRRALAVAGIVALGGVLLIGPGRIVEAFQDPLVSAEQGGGAQLASGTGRYQYWETALEAFRDEPLVGIGAGGYESYWDENGDLPRSVRFAHSLPLQTAAELGLAGLAALLGAFGVALAAAVSRARAGSAEAGASAALIVTGITVSLLEWTWEIPAVAIPVVIAAALACGPATAIAPEPSRAWSSLRRALNGVGLTGAPGAGRSRARLAAIQPALLVVGVAAIAAAAVLWSVEVRLESSERALREGRLDAAAREARAAALLAPWDSAPRRQLAVIERTAGNGEAAARELDLAIERSPRDWELWFFASRLDQARGEEEAAEVALLRARALNPNHPLFRANLR